MKELQSQNDVEAVFQEETAILFKHSTRCPISAAAHREMDVFLERTPDAPVYLLDVNEMRDASQGVAQRTGIEHESPQVILLRQGRPAWHASRFEVKADALAEAARTP